MVLASLSGGRPTRMASPRFLANVASDGPLLHVMSQAHRGRPAKSTNLQQELELA